jgi:hypothetical protein
MLDADIWHSLNQKYAQRHSMEYCTIFSLSRDIFCLRIWLVVDLHTSLPRGRLQGMFIPCHADDPRERTTRREIDRSSSFLPTQSHPFLDHGLRHAF